MITSSSSRQTNGKTAREGVNFLLLSPSDALRLPLFISVFFPLSLSCMFSLTQSHSLTDIRCPTHDNEQTSRCPTLPSLPSYCQHLTHTHTHTDTHTQDRPTYNLDKEAIHSTLICMCVHTHHEHHCHTQ